MKTLDNFQYLVANLCVYPITGNIINLVPLFAYVYQLSAEYFAGTFSKDIRK